MPAQLELSSFFFVFLVSSLSLSLPSLSSAFFPFDPSLVRVLRQARTSCERFSCLSTRTREHALSQSSASGRVSSFFLSFSLASGRVSSFFSFVLFCPLSSFFRSSFDLSASSPIHTTPPIHNPGPCARRSPAGSSPSMATSASRTAVASRRRASPRCARRGSWSSCTPRRRSTSRITSTT